MSDDAVAMRTVRIGLTGPIGCGKSTIAGWLGAMPGGVVVDADRVAREVLAPRTPETAAVVRRFGASLLWPDGSLDRAALGGIVFADPDALRDLEAIVHPAVRPRVLAAISTAESGRSPAVVIEAIKLVEGGLADLCDEVWLVTCAPDVQRQRLLGRGSTPDDAEARIAAQGDLDERLRPRATRVIDSSADPATVRAAVEAAYADAVARAR